MSVKEQLIQGLSDAGCSAETARRIGMLYEAGSYGEVLRQMKIQRCCFHKTANILDIQRKQVRIAVPKCVQRKATEMIRDMHMADTRENALKAYDRFVETFGAKYEKAVENLKKDGGG